MPSAIAPAVRYDELLAGLTANSQRRLYQACATCGLTPTQYLALRTIRELDEPRMSDLAARLGLTPGAVTTLLDRLEKHGLAERSADGQDRRITCVRVLPKGLDACRRADAIRRDQSLLAYDGLSPEEQAHLLVGLEALSRAWAQVPEVVS